MSIIPATRTAIKLDDVSDSPPSVDGRTKELDLTHLIITLLIQLLFGIFSRNWIIGGIFMVAFYLGREITQAEYRWISQFGSGRRANMPWWGSFDPGVWTIKSVLDVALPILGVVVVFAIAQATRRFPKR